MELKKVFIEAGHGRTKSLFGYRADPGAIASDGTTERELNKAIARHVRDAALEIVYIGVEEELTLEEKIRKINGFGFDTRNSLLVSIHCNSAGAQASGVEGWHYAGSAESKKLAASVVDEIADRVGLKNRGVFDERKNRHGRLGIIHDTAPLAVLIEAGFLSNKNDLAILKKDAALVGAAIAHGIKRFCGLKTDDLSVQITKNLSAIWLMTDRLHGEKRADLRALAADIQDLAHKTASIVRAR